MLRPSSVEMHTYLKTLSSAWAPGRNLAVGLAAKCQATPAGRGMVLASGLEAVTLTYLKDYLRGRD